MLCPVMSCVVSSDFMESSEKCLGNAKAKAVADGDGDGETTSDAMETDRD